MQLVSSKIFRQSLISRPSMTPRPIPPSDCQSCLITEQFIFWDTCKIQINNQLWQYPGMYSNNKRNMNCRDVSFSVLFLNLHSIFSAPKKTCIAVVFGTHMRAGDHRTLFHQFDTVRDHLLPVQIQVHIPGLAEYKDIRTGMVENGDPTWKY